MALFADRGREERYELDELAMSTRLSQWGEEAGGRLELLEVYVVGEDAAPSHHRYGERHLRLQVQRGPNADALREWMPLWQGRLTLIGPGGSFLGGWEAATAGHWVYAGHALNKALEDWLGPAFEELWRAVEAAGPSWRAAVEPLAAWRRSAAAAELEARLAPLLEVSHRDPGAAAARVRLGALLLLAARSGAELSESALRQLRRGRLYKDSPLVRAADVWYRAARTADPAGREAALAELFGGRRGDGVEELVAVRRLALRGSALERRAAELLADSRPADWERRSLLLRLLADRSAPGQWLPGDASEPGLPLPSVPGIEEEPSWRVRLAWAEALAAFPRREAVRELIDGLARESHPRVIERLAASLEALTGMRHGARVDAWERWFAELPEDWRTRAAPEPPWAPGPPAPVPEFTSAQEGFFRTDLERVVFVIDVSQSMRDGLADEVRRNLERQLDLFEADAQLGLVLFAERAFHRETRPVLRSAGARVKADLVRFYEGQPKEGKTDLGAALEAAFAYPEVEHVFLVTDGFPTEGEHRSAAELVELADRLNAVRRVRLDTLLLRVGGQYFEEDLGGRELPVPTEAERARWAREARGLAARDDFSILHALSAHHEGRTRVGFANQRYSRDGPPPEDL